MIRSPKASETLKLQSLWALCFSDTKEERDWYFSNLYHPDEVLADFEGDTPVAMLQLIPTALRVGETAQPACYVYGVCTHPDYRRQGRMRRLLDTAHRELEERGVHYAFLKPENPAVYEPFGYRITARQRVTTASFPEVPAAICDTPGLAALNAIYERATAGFSHVNLRSDAWWQNALSGNVRVLYQGGKPAAYAVYDDGFVDELIALNDTAATALLGSISRGRHVTVRTPAPTGDGYAMTRPIGNAPPLPDDGYLGLLFD